MIDFGLILKECRVEFGFTQPRLAEIMGVNVTTIALWESCATYPSIESLKKLADIYQVSIDYLTGLDSKKAIVLDKLTINQKNLLKTLVLEFQNSDEAFSERQKTIISDLIDELTAK